MIKIGATLIILSAAIVCMGPTSAQQPGRASPHDTISAVIGGKGGARVTIYYGRPLTKGRKIFGGLVPWDKAWRAGADEATTLVTQAPLMFGETMIPAGAYTLYLVPSEKGATKLAFGTKIGGWGIPVDVKNDLVRVDVKTDKLDKAVDQFTIDLATQKGQPKGELKMMWENTQFSAPFTVKK